MLEICSPRNGKVEWVYEIREEHEDVTEGVLLVGLEADVSKESRLSTWKL